MRRVLIEIPKDAGENVIKNAIGSLLRDDSAISSIYHIQCKVGSYMLWDEYVLSTESDGENLATTLMRLDGWNEEAEEGTGKPIKSWNSKDADLKSVIEEILSICL